MAHQILQTDWLSTRLPLAVLLQQNDAERGGGGGGGSAGYYNSVVGTRGKRDVSPPHPDNAEDYARYSSAGAGSHDTAAAAAAALQHQRFSYGHTSSSYLQDAAALRAEAASAQRQQPPPPPQPEGLDLSDASGFPSAARPCEVSEIPCVPAWLADTLADTGLATANAMQHQCLDAVSQGRNTASFSAGQRRTGRSVALALCGLSCVDFAVKDVQVVVCATDNAAVVKLVRLFRSLLQRSLPRRVPDAVLQALVVSGDDTTPLADNVAKLARRTLPEARGLQEHYSLVVVASPFRLRNLVARAAFDPASARFFGVHYTHEYASASTQPSLAVLRERLPRSVRVVACLDTRTPAFDLRAFLGDGAGVVAAGAAAEEAAAERGGARFRVRQHNIATEEAGKMGVLVDVVASAASAPRVVVVCGTKRKVDLVARHVEAATRLGRGRTVYAHDGLTQKAREAAVAAFRCGTFPLLVTTDAVAERMLDECWCDDGGGEGVRQPPIEVVIGFDFPASAATHAARARLLAPDAEQPALLTLCTDADTGALREDGRQEDYVSAMLSANPLVEFVTGVGIGGARATQPPPPPATPAQQQQPAARRRPRWRSPVSEEPRPSTRPSMVATKPSGFTGSRAWRPVQPWGARSPSPQKKAARKTAAAAGEPEADPLRARLFSIYGDNGYTSGAAARRPAAGAPTPAPADPPRRRAPRPAPAPETPPTVSRRVRGPSPAASAAGRRRVGAGAGGGGAGPRARAAPPPQPAAQPQRQMSLPLPLEPVPITVTPPDASLPPTAVPPVVIDTSGALPPPTPPSKAAADLDASVGSQALFFPQAAAKDEEEAAEDAARARASDVEEPSPVAAEAWSPSPQAVAQADEATLAASAQVELEHTLDSAFISVAAVGPPRASSPTPQPPTPPVVALSSAPEAVAASAAPNGPSDHEGSDGSGDEWPAQWPSEPAVSAGVETAAAAAVSSAAASSSHAAASVAQAAARARTASSSSSSAPSGRSAVPAAHAAAEPPPPPPPPPAAVVEDLDSSSSSNEEAAAVAVAPQSSASSSSSSSSSASAPAPSSSSSSSSSSRGAARSPSASTSTASAEELPRPLPEPTPLSSAAPSAAATSSSSSSSSASDLAEFAPLSSRGRGGSVAAAEPPSRSEVSAAGGGVVVSEVDGGGGGGGGGSMRSTAGGSMKALSDEAKLLEMFRLADKDHDGYLNYLELQALLKKTTGGSVTPEQFAAINEETGCEEGLTLDALRECLEASGGVGAVYDAMKRTDSSQLLKPILKPSSRTHTPVSSTSRSGFPVPRAGSPQLPSLLTQSFQSVRSTTSSVYYTKDNYDDIMDSLQELARSPTGQSSRRDSFAGLV